MQDPSLHLTPRPLGQEPGLQAPAGAGSPGAPASRLRPTRKLDTVVKLGLGVFVGSFLLIWAGMFLTRPDRSIPPYSIGSQEGTTVTVHVPGWTSDAAIETLIARFGKVGRETGDFGKMKIQPTTPGDPAGRYRRIAIYIFTHDTWADPEMLHRYLATADSRNPEDMALRQAFEKAVRGLYRLDEAGEEGRIGPILNGKESAGTAAYARVLFKGPVTAGSGVPSGTTAPSPSPLSGARADRGP